MKIIFETEEEVKTGLGAHTPGVCDAFTGGICKTKKEHPTYYSGSNAGATASPVPVSKLKKVEK